MSLVLLITLAIVSAGVALRRNTSMSPYQLAVVAMRPKLNSIYSEYRAREPSLQELYQTSMPRLIWQTQRSHSSAPGLATQLFESWSYYNPTFDHLLLDDSEIKDFVLYHYNQTVLDWFNTLPKGVMKADAFRYMALYFHGGVYADADTECKQPIQKWVKPGCRLVVSVQDDNFFCQWALASVPGHSAMRAVLQLMLHRMAHEREDPPSSDFVFRVTGPGVFTDALRQHLGLASDLKLHDFVGSTGRKLADGVCLISRAEMKRSLRNLYSSRNKWLQGGSWQGWLS